MKGVSPFYDLLRCSLRPQECSLVHLVRSAKRRNDGTDASHENLFLDASEVWAKPISYESSTRKLKNHHEDDSLFQMKVYQLI